MWYNRRGLGSFRALFLGAAGTYSTDELEDDGLEGDGGVAAPLASAAGLDGQTGSAASAAATSSALDGDEGTATSPIGSAIGSDGDVLWRCLPCCDNET